MKRRGTTQQDNLVDIRHEKVSPFVKFEIYNPTPTLLFIRSPHKEALQDMEFYDKLVDRFQDLPKVKNPVVSNKKV